MTALAAPTTVHLSEGTTEPFNSRDVMSLEARQGRPFPGPTAFLWRRERTFSQVPPHLFNVQLLWNVGIGREFAQAAWAGGLNYAHESIQNFIEYCRDQGVWDEQLEDWIKPMLPTRVVSGVNLGWQGTFGFQITPPNKEAAKAFADTVTLWAIRTIPNFVKQDGGSVKIYEGMGPNPIAENLSKKKRELDEWHAYGSPSLKKRQGTGSCSAGKSKKLTNLAGASQVLDRSSRGGPGC
jgi:hypothetical protein